MDRPNAPFAIWRIALLSAALCLASGPLLAQDVPAWAQLSADQRDAFSNLSDRWDQLPVPQRQKLLDGYSRWQAMSPADREKARRNMQKYRGLTPREKQELREKYEREKQDD